MSYNMDRALQVFKSHYEESFFLHLTQIYRIMKLPELIQYFFFNQDCQFCTTIISESTL